MAETIRLVGVFDDKITPKLKALNKQINLLNRKFRQFDRTLTGVNAKMKKLAKSSDRIRLNFAKTHKTMSLSNRQLKQYATSANQAAIAQGKLNRQLRNMKPARGGGGMGMPRGGGGRGGRAGFGMGSFLAMGAAAGGVGAAVGLAVDTLRSVQTKVMAAYRRASEAESQAIQMAGTIQTLGGVGDFGKSMQMANQNLADVSKIAAKLPGATAEYAKLLAQTMDDQIEAFGSLEAVQADLKKGQRSVTALLGVAGQLANMNTEMVGFDLMQLRVNPRNFRQSQILTRNPTLMKYYQEGLEKFGGNYFKSLEYGLNKAITKEQVDAITGQAKNAMEGINSALFDPFSGILGMRRNVEGLDGKQTSVIQQIGQALSPIADVLTEFKDVMIESGIDPMKMLTHFIQVLAKALRFLADFYIKNLLPGVKLLFQAFTVITDALKTLLVAGLQPVIMLFQGLGKILFGTIGEFNLLKFVLGVVIAPFALLGIAILAVQEAFSRFVAFMAGLPFGIGNLFGGADTKKKYEKSADLAARQRREMEGTLGELLGIQQGRDKKAAEASIKKKGLGGALQELLAMREGKGGSGGGGPATAGTASNAAANAAVGNTGPRGRTGAQAAKQTKEATKTKIAAQQQADNVSSVVATGSKTNEILGRDLSAIRIYTHKIYYLQEDIFGLLGVMLGMSKKQARQTIRDYNTGPGGGRGGAAFVGGGTGYGSAPAVSAISGDATAGAVPGMPMTGSIGGTGGATGSRIMKDLMARGYSKAAAAGIVGNLAVESDQFRADTEYGSPLGALSGRGWAQWTGVRRKQFDAYTKEKGLNPRSYEANFGFLMKELNARPGSANYHWTHSGGTSKLKGMQDPKAASAYFEKYFERPGIPHSGRRRAETMRFYQGDFRPGGAPQGLGGPMMKGSKALSAAPMTSGYGMRNHPIYGGRKMHHGKDYGLPTGTPLSVRKNMKVLFAGVSGSQTSGYGNTVDLQDPDTGLVHRFAHLHKMNVKAGQMLQAGQSLGQVGNTGGSTGSHLHYEVRKGGAFGQSVDPTAYESMIRFGGTPGALQQRAMGAAPPPSMGGGSHGSGSGVNIASMNVNMNGVNNPEQFAQALMNKVNQASHSNMSTAV